jgi:hypothetical protein
VTDPEDGVEEPASTPAEPPVMPTAQEAAATRPQDRERPPEVRYSFVLWVLAGVFGIVDAIVLLTMKQGLIDTSIRNNKNPNATNEQIANGVTILLWMLVVTAVALAAFYALFAFKAQESIRRARLLLTMLCVLTLLFHIFVKTTPFGWLTALLALGATVLLYLPRSLKFYAPGELPT